MTLATKCLLSLSLCPVREGNTQLSPLPHHPFLFQKKKHRKHKHKGKQKNKKPEKSSSSDSTDSSDSPSGEEGTVDLSPQELLRR